MTSLRKELAAWRRDNPVNDDDSRRLFGVGLQTIQRIERADVHPMPELAERIGRQIHSKLPAESPPSGDVAPCPATCHLCAVAGHFSGAAQ